MKYLSLYKTSSEYSADNSRLVPNISLITGERKMFLTNENNIDTTFTEVDIIESFDDIINRFPSPTETGMPGLKIYGDNTDYSRAKNIKLFNDAIQWRSNYISNNGLSDTGQGIIIYVDALMIDNIIMDKYDGNYKCHIEIYANSIELFAVGAVGGSDFLTISSNGSVTNNLDNIFPSPVETAMPGLSIYSDIYSNISFKIINIALYNNARQWRNNYILHNGLSDTGQGISMFVDKLFIDDILMDKYDRYYHYHIDIYNDRIILLNDRDSSEVLTISRNGSSVTILDIFNKFPSDTSLHMHSLKIYTDNTDQSKSNNIELYNNAQRWRKDHISYKGWSDTGQPIKINVDGLIIGNEILDKYDRHFNYYIDIYKDHIILLNGYNNWKILTIFSDGSISEINLSPTPTTTR